MKVKLTNKFAKVPFRANPTDAGADLYSTKNIMIKAHSQEFIDFGVQIELPKGTMGLVFARSGLGSKLGLRPRNCVGVIDENYRGNIGVMLENHSESDYQVCTYDRIAQLVVVPIITPTFEVVDELDMDTDRGQGGFGSSGIK